MAKATTKPPSSPQQTASPSVVSVSVEDRAFEIFVKTYMDTAGKTTEFLANRAFEVAEAFVEVANKRLK